MKITRAFTAIGLFFLAAPGVYAACSSATAAGTFGFTTSGTLILPTGPAPVAAVGVVNFDRDGNTTGSQDRSVGACLRTKHLPEPLPLIAIAQ